MAAVIWSVPKFRDNYKPDECPKRSDIVQLMKLLNGMRYGPGRDIRMTASGIVIPRPAGSVPRPWDIVSMDPETGEVEFEPGEIEIHSNTGTAYYEPASMTITLENGENYIYVEIEPHATTPAAVLGSITSVQPEGDDETYRPKIWRIDYDDDEDNPSITPVKQYRSQNIEFVGWRK